VKLPLLSVDNLYVQYVTDENIVYAVNGLSFSLTRGESLGFVGETGAGKTTAALSIMQLLPEPAGIITEGSISFKDSNLIENSKSENIKIRGNGISMIFQDPMTALNPTMKISSQMMEVIRAHKKTTRNEAKNLCLSMLKKVGIGEDRFNDYPHQLSGGMKQRVIIAMSLLLNPEILIADEPTTALDVTIQAQILEIMKDLITYSDMSLLLITHDLGVVAETCDNVAVMYAGSIIESGTVREVFRNPLHPYTQGLFASTPNIEDESVRLTPIIGTPPNPTQKIVGCAFEPRCPKRLKICKSVRPSKLGPHSVWCHLYSEQRMY
jgi:peptide/nickel transport system ATP-binding protein